MKKSAMFAMLALSVTVAIAQTQAPQQAPKTLDKAAQQAKFKAFLSHIGGPINDMRAQKGRLVVVNAQTEADAATVGESTRKFEKDAHIRIEHEKGTFELKSARRVGEATVYVVSDDALPATLVAADDHWGVVNVAKLRTDKPAFFKARVRKQIVRVAGLVLGAGDSALYPLCLTGNVKNLDEVPSEQLPQDVMQRLAKAMDDIGIHGYARTTYRRACEEGWAPAPTNDIQKAVWDKVHAMPSDPIKIKPETRKVSE